MKTILLIISSLFTLLFCSCKEEVPVTGDGFTYTPTTALRDKASFPFGVAIQAGRISNPAYGSLVSKEFSSLTAEYEMKQNITATGPATYNWTPTDQIVNFAQANNQRVHGHALLWHSAVPDWITNFSGSSAEFDTVMKNYIHAVVGRYKGKVASWDVVNEAFEDQSGNLRNTVFRTKMGDDYIARCFQYAREADPDVWLFYNDYGTIYDNKKLDAMLAMIDDFQTRGIPIDGVGFQMHISYNWPSLSQIQNAVDKVKSRGLKIHFSELDIRANPDGDLTQLTTDRATDLQKRYKDIVTLYKGIPEAQQFGITVWGLKDNESWLINFWGNPEWPLLFDAESKYKLAHKGVIEAL
ncbi:MAG: endo-1,4-beta-xylanase [Bacteroidia bacterium]